MPEPKHPSFILPDWVENDVRANGADMTIIDCIKRKLLDCSADTFMSTLRLLLRPKTIAECSSTYAMQIKKLLATKGLPLPALTTKEEQEMIQTALLRFVFPDYNWIRGDWSATAVVSRAVKRNFGAMAACGESGRTFLQDLPAPDFENMVRFLSSKPSTVN